MYARSAGQAKGEREEESVSSLTFVELDGEVLLDKLFNVQVDLVEVGRYTIRHAVL